MTSFYPGPSRVHDKVPTYVKDAHKSGILSLNHRSPEFESLSKKTVVLLRKKLAIPSGFTIVFTSSATECWEVLAQSLVKKESIHIHNGAFGAKWFDYARRIHPASKSVLFDRDEMPDSGKMVFDSGEMICITQNETSNGTQVTNQFINEVAKNNPGHLIAVDATSSMAGIHLDFKSADIWFASVQKCFGLPAGLAIMALSQKAQAAAREINENLHYNSIAFMMDMMAKWQTSYTPNVLAIYLLMRSLEDGPGIRVTHKQTVSRFKAWQKFFSNSVNFKLLISNPSVRSHTVVAVQADHALMENLKKAARKNGFLLGEGYGALKKESFRIANFPALKQKEINSLMRFLSRF